MKKNPKLKIAGFFGQSGAGKTTIIRNVKTAVDGKVILQNTGIIRYLFQKNDYYVNAVDLYSRLEYTLSDMKPQEKIAKIDETYDKYIRSQFQLLNDFSTEVFLAYRETYVDDSILLIDRSPIDFYAITVCGLAFLQSKLGKPLNAYSANLLELIKKTAEKNTKNFFDCIVVTKPWQLVAKSSELEDGVRDQYLSEWYTDKNWYDVLDSVAIEGVKTFEIGESVRNLISRAELVESFVKDI